MKKTKVNVIILILVTLLVLYFTLKDDFSGVLSLTFHINIFWIIIAFILIFLSWFFLSITLHTIANNHEKKLSIKEALESTLITNFFNAITPFSSGGQPFQVLNLRNYGYSLTSASNIIIQNSTLYQIVLVLFGFIAFIINYIFGYFPSDNILKKLIILGFTINLLVIVLLLFVSFGKKINHTIIEFFINFLHKIKIIKNRDEKIKKFNSYIERFYEGNNHFLKNKKVFWKSLVFIILSFICMYLVPLFVAYSLNSHNINILETITSSAYVALIGSFVPIPGGSGGIEFGFAHFFGFFIQGVTLMAVLLLWRIITYYFGMLIGGLLFIFKKERRN